MSNAPERPTAALRILSWRINEETNVPGTFVCAGDFHFTMEGYENTKATVLRMNGNSVAPYDNLASEVIDVLKDKVTDLQQKLLDKERAYNNRVVEMTQKISMLEQQLIRLHRLELEIEELSVAVAPRPQLHA